MKISQLKTFIVSLGIGEDQVETILSTSANYEELIQQVRDYLHLIDAPVESKIMQLKRFIYNV